MKLTRIVCLILLVAGLNFVSPALSQQNEKVFTRNDYPFVGIGAQAPNFILQDSEGETYNFREFIHDKKIVVLEWIDPLNPYSRKYHDTGSLLHHFYRQERNKIAWFGVAAFRCGDVATISSEIYSPLAFIDRDTTLKILETYKQEMRIPYPILLDEEGNLSRLYGIKQIPTVYIINKDGRVAYHGAIDNDPNELGENYYLLGNLNLLLKNQPLHITSTETVGLKLHLDRNLR